MRFLLTSSAFLGMIAVILGAFGAHALKTKLSPEQLISFNTGIRYQFYHVFAIISCALLSQRLNTNLNLSGYFFLIGTLLFSGSIYLLSCKDILNIDGFSKILGPITPLGGLCFIIGWLLMAIQIVKSNFQTLQ